MSSHSRGRRGCHRRPVRRRLLLLLLLLVAVVVVAVVVVAVVVSWVQHPPLPRVSAPLLSCAAT
jgi:hypothetical protein